MYAVGCRTMWGKPLTSGSSSSSARASSEGMPVRTGTISPLGFQTTSRTPNARAASIAFRL